MFRTHQRGKACLSWLTAFAARLAVSTHAASATLAIITMSAPRTIGLRKPLMQGEPAHTNIEPRWITRSKARAIARMLRARPTPRNDDRALITAKGWGELSTQRAASNDRQPGFQPSSMAGGHARPLARMGKTAVNDVRRVSQSQAPHAVCPACPL